MYICSDKDLVMREKKVAFYTLGCKLNFAETSTIARQFNDAGYTRVDWNETADVYIINTCTVTDNADKRFRYLIHGVRKRAPQSRIVAIGCYAQINPSEIVNTTGIDLVLGIKDKFDIIKHLNALDNESSIPQVIECDIHSPLPYHGAYSLAERTRAFLKIQDGCDYRCTYCTIPLARGGSRSESLDSIISSAREIVRNGTREIVLTGVNTGDWGRGLDGKHSFIEVVKALDEIEGLERVRISSIEPNLLTDEILEFISTSRRFVHHFHVPLQSGSDNTLRAMKRRYNTDGYRARIDKIKSLMSDACIGADVIVGFPTESDSDFNETREFIKSLPLSYLHVFTYSERENTPAAQMEISVPHTIRSERSKILHMVGEEKRTVFYSEHIGTVRPVLWESDVKDGYITGFTDNYIKVKHPYVESLPCSITRVTLTGIDTDGTMMCKDI